VLDVGVEALYRVKYHGERNRTINEESLEIYICKILRCIYCEISQRNFIFTEDLVVAKLVNK
jgi:hypothetical protein